MPIGAVDAAVAAWSVVWLLAAIAMIDAAGRVDESGEAVVTSGGLRETSGALRRAGGGLHETSEALSGLRRLPFVSGDPRAPVERTADEVDRLAARVATTTRDARRTGLGVQDTGRTLTLVLGAATALAPTVPLALMYLLLRPLVAERLRRV